MTETLMVVLASAFSLLGGILIGGLLESTCGGTQRLERKLRKAEREVDDLREYIWLVTAPTPTKESDTTAGALPTESVEVERSRHLNHVEDN